MPDIAQDDADLLGDNTAVATDSAETEEEMLWSEKVLLMGVAPIATAATLLISFWH